MRGATTINGASDTPGTLTVNGNVTVTINNATTFGGVTINNGRINANTNNAVGSGTISLTPTGAVSAFLVNATTLGTGPLTNVTLE
jgi:hypothetical protein